MTLENTETTWTFDDDLEAGDDSSGGGSSNKSPVYQNLPIDGKIYVMENTTDVIDIDATDDYDSEGNGLKYFIVGGADKDLYTIDQHTGKLSFINPPDFENPLDAHKNNIYDVIVRVVDSHGAYNDQSLWIEVTDKPDTNNLPDALDDHYTVMEGGDINLKDQPDQGLLSNDTDPDGDSLRVKAVNGESFTHEIVVEGSNGGQFTVLENGAFKFWASSDFEDLNAGETRDTSITYTIDDGNGGMDTATVKVTVTGKDDVVVNNAPDAVDDTNSTTADKQVGTFVLENDSDPDGDPLKIKSFTQAANGEVRLNNNGTPEDTTDDKLVYIPEAGFTGTDSFTYTIGDGKGGMDTATVTITVGDGGTGGENNAPDAVDDTNTTTVGQKVGTFVLENDSDPDGDPLKIKSFTQAANGEVRLNNNGTPEDTTDDKLVYIPNEGFVGTDSFTYAVADPSGAMDMATVTITVGDGGTGGGDNNAPDAVDDTNTTTVGQKVGTFVLENDSDPDGDPLKIKSFTQAANGEVRLNNNGTPEDTTDDKLVYIPNEGFVGTDSFTYAVADPSGAMDMANVTIEVIDPNPAPEIKATLVGTDSIYEGDQGSYKIQLDSASDRDRTFTIQVEDGTANRVNHDAADQDIIWGGFYDIRNSYGEVIKVVYDRVPNGTDPATGDRPATGPGDASWDYTVYQDSQINVGDTITVTVAAGQTMSETFEVQAWKEQVTVDRDGPNSDNFLEGTENFSINVVGKDNTVFHQDSLQVEILDKTHYGFVSPIAIDLNGDGVKTISINEGVTFDMDNDGVAEKTGWLSGGDGFLAVDKNGNGLIDNQDELFGGDGTRGAFEKLASYDSNGDGFINKDDTNFHQLLIWQDANQDGITDTYKDSDLNELNELNELKSLDAFGVSELSLDYRDQSILDQGNKLGEISSAVVNGETRDLVDVYFTVEQL